MWQVIGGSGSCTDQMGRKEGIISGRLNSQRPRCWARHEEEVIIVTSVDVRKGIITATGGQILGRALAAMGMDYVWGIAGHTNIAALDGFVDSGLNYVSVRHEQVAAHAADGYWRATHRPGVVLLHNGPGLTNALTGIGDAACDCSAQIIIAANAALRHKGRDAFQEIGFHQDASQAEVARPLVKRVWQIHDAGQISDVLVRAYNAATSGCPGPVLIDIPMDVLSRRAEVDLAGLDHRRPSGKRLRGDHMEIGRAAELLAEAQKPVILAGGGVPLSEGTDELLALAEYLGAPVVTTMAGKGSIDENHPLAAGTTGRAGTPVANGVALNADILLALGTQFPEQDSSSWAQGKTFSIPPTRVVHVDIDPRQIGKIYPVEVGILGDVKSVLVDLLEALRERTPARDWRNSERIARMEAERINWREKLAQLQSSKVVPIRPERVLQEVRDVLPPEGVVVGDVGWGKNGVSQQYLAYRPNTTMVASGYGTMGFAAAAALGVRAGLPKTPVVSLTGDGGLSSVLSTLITAVEYSVDVVWVVFNNAAYSAISGLQKSNFGRAIGTEFSLPHDGSPYLLDFAAVAQAFGAWGKTVELPDNLGPTLREALTLGRPAVINVLVDRDASYEPTGYWDVSDIYKNG